MKIGKIKIQNFRKLIDIEFDCKETINTIVGPNGIGKSSIIDAVRLTKSILLQSAENEVNSALQAMGVFSPHTNTLLFNTICNDIHKETKILITIRVNQEELKLVQDKIGEFAILRLQNQIGQLPGNRLNLIGYLSSPPGQQHYQQIILETKSFLDAFVNERKMAHIELTASSAQVSGKNGFDQELISFIFRNTTSIQTLFSVFPADRNFPSGDVNIQLGQSDLQQQIQSYSIQPNLKFHRLKNTLVNHLLMNNNDISLIRDDFELIFENLLPGKELHGIVLEEYTNKLSVLIKETSSNAIYDIDFLSSGEKGLLLTLFLLIRTIRKGGIVIIDEPELHLNPAVCKNIISFLKTYVVEKIDVQIILTTHSAEILTATKDNEEFQLLHLIDSTTISPIFKNDNNEASEAIRALGVSTADLLFNKGVIYLEGTTDEEFINEVLRNFTVNYKIQSLGGRTIIENEVKILQETDRKSQLKGLHIFILDFDNKPTSLIDTTNVKIIQWDRYSFENYLLNTDILYGILREVATKETPSNRATLKRTIKDLAFKQIDFAAIHEIHGTLIPQSIGLTKRDITDPISALQVAQLLSDKILNLKEALENFDKNTWEAKFIENTNNKIEALRDDWDDNWKKFCKGKELLIEIYKYFGISNYKDFVKRLIVANKEQNSEEWQVIKNKIEVIIQR